MRCVERRIAYDDGAETTLECWGEDGPAFLAVHGIGSSRRDFRRLGEALSGRARLFAYDQRGHGDAEEFTGPMEFERLQRDLASVAIATGEQIELLIGHSWGGAVALLGGLRLGVRRVLAIDPLVAQRPGTWEDDYVADLRAALALPPAEREAPLRAMFAGAHEADVAAKLHALGRMRIEPIERLGAENAVDAGGWNLRAALAAYPKPLLVLLAAEADSIVDPDDLAALRASGGPHVRVERYADAPHALHRTHFERFVRDVESFAAVPEPR